MTPPDTTSKKIKRGKFSSRTMQPADWDGLTYFSAKEFNPPERMGLEFMKWLDGVRAAAGVPMTITSSYRTTEHNRAVGGASNSAHVDDPCNAVDIGKRPTPDDPHWNISRGAIMRAAFAQGCVRLGFYANGSLHIDRTEDVRPAAVWNVVDNPAK